MGCISTEPQSFEKFVRLKMVHQLLKILIKILLFTDFYVIFCHLPCIYLHQLVG